MKNVLFRLFSNHFIYCLRNRTGLKNIPIRESRFFGTATHVASYEENLLKHNGNYVYKDKEGKLQQGTSAVKSAVHKADFVGNKLNLGLTGFNEVTGGDCWFCYSHSGYVAEVPSKFLRNEQGQYIDLKGNVVTKPVENPYLKDFKEKWNPQNKWDNPSLPKLLNHKSKNGE